MQPPVQFVELDWQHLVVHSKECVPLQTHSPPLHVEPGLSASQSAWPQHCSAQVPPLQLFQVAGHPQVPLLHTLPPPPQSGSSQHALHALLQMYGRLFGQPQVPFLHTSPVRVLQSGSPQHSTSHEVGHTFGVLVGH
jgi:hypothetical protein